METILIKALQLIVALALLIILHEGGHFFAAKLFKVRVEKFYLFFDWKFSIFSTYSNWWRKLMGKAPVKKKENGSYEYEGTEYGIGWIPLGGYVAISGMVDESSFKEDGSQKSFWKQLPQLLKNIIIKNSDVKGEPWEFRTHPAWQRLIIMLGGIIMNFITAFVIYAMVLFTWGESFVKSEDMSYGMKFSEQAKADGFQDGDIIIKTDDEVIESWSTSVLQEMSNAKTVTVLRENPEAKDGARQEVVINMPEELSLLDMIEPPLYASMRAPLQIDSILPGTPAEDMGLKKTDKICSVNGIAVEDFNDFQNSLIALQKALPENANFGDSLKARQITLVLNDSVTKQVTLTPEFTLGFANAMPYQDKITTKTYGFFESFPAGFRYGMQTLASYVDQMKYVFTKKGARQVGGFISIGKIFPDAWNWQKFWLLTAFLSIVLGFMNVLPIPALDGGHALFATFELLTGKRLNDNFLLVVQYFGMYLLLAIMVLAQMNDILRLFNI
ncbi:MAG: site-2 protease family protein [Bacteroidaceae bacterium]|jgi:regulator of sigma E protease|nr:site-2 protease family protein [Bacteroidaceae bacterium]